MVDFLFGKLDGQQRNLTSGNINGVSKEYLLKMAQGDEGQIALINSIFANKNYNPDGNDILDNEEWQQIQKDLMGNKSPNDKNEVKVDKKNFLKNLGITKENQVSDLDLYNVLNSINIEDDDIIGVEKQGNKTIVQFKSNKTCTYKNVDGQMVLDTEQICQDDIITEKQYSEDGKSLKLERIIDTNQNRATTKLYNDNGKVVRTEILDNNGPTFTVEEPIESQNGSAKKKVIVYNGIDDKCPTHKIYTQETESGGINIKTGYATLDDLTNSKPEYIKTTRGNLDLTYKSFIYKDDGSWSSETYNYSSDEYIERENFTINSDGTAIYKKLEGKQATKKDFRRASEVVFYDNSDPRQVTLKKVRNIDPKTGLFKSEKILDKDGNVVRETSFEIDGNITKAIQGATGNCYLCGAINSLVCTTNGLKRLHDNRSINKDAEGNFVSCTIEFPGCQIVKDMLDKKGIKPVYIQGKYTINMDELITYSTDMRLSIGDGDMLLYEIAYNKYRDDLNKTVEEANIDTNWSSIGGTIFTGYNSNSDKNSSKLPIEGGFGEEARFVLTGQKSECWWNNNSTDNQYGIYIDEKNHKLVPKKNVTYERTVTTPQDISMSPNNKSKNNKKHRLVELTEDFQIIGTWYQDDNDFFNKTIAQLKKDASDGKLDEYAVTVDFNVNYSETGEFGGHDMAIVGIGKNDKGEDVVYILDSNDSHNANPEIAENNTPYEMTVTDLKKYCKQIGYTKVK